MTQCWHSIDNLADDGDWQGICIIYNSAIGYASQQCQSTTHQAFLDASPVILKIRENSHC